MVLAAAAHEQEHDDGHADDRRRDGGDQADVRARGPRARQDGVRERRHRAGPGVARRRRPRRRRRDVRQGGRALGLCRSALPRLAIHRDRREHVGLDQRRWLVGDRRHRLRGHQLRAGEVRRWARLARRAELRRVLHAEIADVRELPLDRIDRDGQDRFARDRHALRRIARLELDPRLRSLPEQLLHEPADRRHGERDVIARRELLDPLDQLVRGLEPLLGDLREQPHRELLELPRQPRAVPRRRRRRLVDDRRHVLEVAVAAVQALGGQHLPQHDAEREQVAAAIDGRAAALLGRQVADLSLHCTRPRLLRAVLGLRDAEVDDLDAAVVADHQI